MGGGCFPMKEDGAPHGKAFPTKENLDFSTSDWFIKPWNFQWIYHS